MAAAGATDRLARPHRDLVEVALVRSAEGRPSVRIYRDSSGFLRVILREGGDVAQPARILTGELRQQPKSPIGR